MRPIRISRQEANNAVEGACNLATSSFATTNLTGARVLDSLLRSSDPTSDPNTAIVAHLIRIETPRVVEFYVSLCPSRQSASVLRLEHVWKAIAIHIATRLKFLLS